MSHSAGNASAPTDPTVMPYSIAMRCTHGGGSSTATDYIAKAIAGSLGDLGFQVTPELLDTLSTQTQNMQQLALLFNLYDGCTQGGDEVGLPNGLAAQLCTDFLKDVMRSHGASPLKGDSARYDAYRKAILGRLEALLGMLSPEQRAMPFARVLMGMAKYLQSKWFGAEAGFNFLQGMDLGSVLVSAAIRELFQLLKITPKDKLCELHERFEDVLNKIKPEHVVLSLMPEAYQRDSENVERVLLANAKEETSDHDEEVASDPGVSGPMRRTRRDRQGGCTSA